MPIYSVQGPDGRIYDVEGPAGASEEQILGAVRRQFLATPASAPEKKGSGLGDIARSFGLGAVGATKAITSAAGADNEAARALGRAGESLQEGFSASRKAELQAQAERMKKAEASGSTLEEIKAGALNVLEAPLQSAAQAVGSFAPLIPTMFLAKPLAALGLGARAIMGVRGAIGGAQGAGAVKQNIYDTVLEAEKTDGKTDEQAAAAASRAQSYISENADQILLGTGLGVAAGTSGVERILPGGVRGAASKTQEALAKRLGARTASGITTAAAEMPLEGLQGGQERLAANLALQRTGRDVDAFTGVAGQATQEALTGALGAGPIGALVPDRRAEIAEKERQQKEQADAVAAAEAAKNTPEALRQLDTEFRTADQQLKALNAQLTANRPKKGATDEQKQAYDTLKAQRDELLTTYKPLRQEFMQRKEAIDELQMAEQSAIEVAAAQGQAAAKLPLPSDIPGAQPFQLSDTSRLMNDYDTMRGQVSALEQQLAAGPDLDTQTQLTQQRGQLMARMNEMAPVIEERGGVTDTEPEFAKKMAAAEKERLRLLEIGDFDAAANQAEKVRDLQTRAPFLQELNDFRTKAGQNRELTLEEPAQPEGAGVKYVSPTGKPVTPFPATATEAAPLPADKPEELAAVQTAQTNVNAAQTALDEAVKTKDTTKIFGAVDALNQAQNTVARAQEDVGRPLLKPAVLDIFSPANLFRTAFANNDTKLLNDLASHADTTALRAALNQNLSEREKLVNVLENRAGVGGDEKAIDPRTGEPGERLKSVKRERADLFSQLYDARQQALFKNGQNLETIERPRTELAEDFQLDKTGKPVVGEDGKPVVVRQYEKPVLDKNGRPVMDTVRLQDIYDQGGPAAVEYERVMQDVEDLSKKVTTKQGNAKKSLYEQLIDLAAQHSALVAQMESGIATPNMREKTTALQAKMGKGEAPAERQMDAKEKFDLQRRIDTLVNKYRLTEGQIAPVRDQITKLYNSLYKTTPLEKTSKAADRKATEAEERKERAKPLKEIADKYGMKSPEYKEALAKQVAESKAAGRVPKVSVSRTAQTAARLAKGDVRKEAETSKQMRDLAIELGQREPEYVRMQANAEKRLTALENKYGKGDPQVRAYSTQVMDALEAKAVGLGKQTPEYKATLKEQVEYVKGALSQSKQTVPTKRTGPVTRTQSSAPTRLVSSSPESREQTDMENKAINAQRRAIKDAREALRSEKEDRDYLRGVETESLELSRDVVALLEKGDVRGALLLISKDPAVDKFSQAVAARLEPFLDVTKVEIKNNMRSDDGKEVLGAATSKLIELNRNGGLSVETLLHEATHAAAERVVQLSETNPNALTKEQKLAINELKALHARVKNDKGITSKNAKSSLSEFVAEVMSNRNLQKQLAQRQWRLVDAWKGVKSIIMRMLGMQKVETMFGASVVAVDQLFVPASAKVGKGRKETRVTRSLSAKDIAALDDGSNSMKQFADQFGQLIKQKDRTPADVERIGAQVIDDMLNSVSPMPRNTGAPRPRSEAEKLQAEHDAKSVVALPTADSLDYKGMVTMSDGKVYDENNPLHYVEATPATFAALEAVNNPSLRKREAESIASQRKTDFLNLISYLMGNYENYTTAETALVLKAAAKYGVISGSNGRLKLVEIGKDNRHNIAVLGKETADAIIEQLRAGKGLKQAFLDGLQKNADDNAKNNERKNGWKKFDQADQEYLPNAYPDDEVDAAILDAGLSDEDIRDNGWDKEATIGWLIENGYLEDRTGGKIFEEAAIALNEGCAGTPWCTGASVSTARSQIEGGDFYVYYNKGRPEVAVRMNGKDRIGEIRGNNPNQALDPAQQQIAADFLRAKKFEKADQYLSEFERREALVKLAKGETKLGVSDLLGDKSPLDSNGKVDDYEINRLLKFRTIDGYGNRPKPVDSVVKFFGQQYLDAAIRAYENNEFVFSKLDVDEDSNTKPVEVEFAGKKYTASPADVKALNRVTVSVYAYGSKPAAPVVLPKLAKLGELSFFRGELDLPALQTVDTVTFFNEVSRLNTVARIKMPTDARVNKVQSYGKKVSGIIEGPQTINLVTLTREGGALTLDLPDTKYVAVLDDPKGVARHFSSEADNAIDNLLKADGLDFADIMRAKRGEATMAQNAAYQKVAKQQIKKFFDALEKSFGYTAYEHALNNGDTAEAFRITNDYRKAIRNAVDDVLELNKYSREAFDKMAKVVKDSTGAEVAYPEGQLIAPKRVGDPPYGAEFTEAPEQRRFAPKDVGVQEDKKGLFSFARKQVNSSSVVAREPGVVDTLLGNIMGLAGRVQFIDQYAALEAATKKGLSAGVISSLEATNANYLLRFGQQRSQFSGQFLTNGPVKAEITRKNGGTETLYRSTKGTSMVDVAQALNKSKLSNDVEQENMFTLYVAGKRAQQVGWDKLNFSSPTQAKAEYDAVIARLNNNDTAKKAFEEAAKLYQEYNAGLLDFLAQTGALSDKKVAELKAISYVPFYRVNNNGEVQLMVDKERPVRIANIKDQPQLKELIGGNTAILPIFTSAAQNTFMLTGMGLRNQAVKETSFMLQKLGIASRVSSGNGPTGANVVRFFKKGEPYYALIDTDAYGIPADLIVRGMEGIKTTLPAVIKLMGMPANILRSFVVRNPAYAVRQIIRDPLNAWMTTGTDAVPVLSSMKELAKMVAGRSDAERKLMETGAISSNVYSGDDQDMAKFLKDMSAGKSGWDKATAMLDTFALQGDAATRAVIYKDSLAKGMSEQEALLRTLESMNFSRRGVSPSMQALSTLIPFFNAQVQGLDVIYRAMKGDMPYSQQLDIRGKMVRRGLMLAAGTIAYAAMMEDDEAYKRAKPEERLANWFVYVPGIDEPVRVPIPFEMGFLFKALPEAVYAMAMQDGKADAALSGLSKLALQTIPLSLPQAVKPLTEAVLGKSFYSGDIESVREKDVLATQRYRDNSTELAKTIGAVTGNIGLSPITIDYLIRGYTGGLGIALVQLANPILAPGDKAEVAQPTTKISKQPFIGGLFQPVEGRGTLDEAYDRMKEIQQVKGTFNDLVDKGKRAEAMAFAQEYSDKLAAASVSGSVQKRLGELAKLERQIKSSPNLSTEQKDVRLAQLDKLKTATATQFLATTAQR
jgi:hypothetical protein